VQLNAGDTMIVSRADATLWRITSYIPGQPSRRVFEAASYLPRSVRFETPSPLDDGMLVLFEYSALVPLT
jgi:hypothetical protein